MPDSFIATGQTRSSAVEVREHQNSLFARRTTEIPSDLQLRIEYNSPTPTQKYVGYGARGLATSDDGWIIYKFTYNGSNQMTLRQTAFDSWDNRDSASYA